MLLSTVRRGWLQFLALAWPPMCPGCGVLLAATEPNQLCPSCYAKLSFWQDKQQTPVPELPLHVDYFTAAFLYKGLIRRLILDYKFHDALELRFVFKMFMSAQLIGVPFPADALVVPVPSHPKRLRQKGFNQAAFLAKDLAQARGLRFAPQVLQRLKPTPPQVGKTKAHRQRQLKGAFSVADGVDVVGKYVVLVDDVWTTGSTAEACAKALKKSGAARVDVVTLAYTC